MRIVPNADDGRHQGRRGRHLAIFAVAAAILALITVVAWRAALRRGGAQETVALQPLEDLDAAGQWLAAAHGLSPRAYASYDLGRETDERCISVIVKPKRAESLLKDLRKRLGPGLIAFIGNSRWYGDEQPNGVELVVAPGESQFDILGIARSDAANYGLNTADLVARLRNYDQQFGIDIFQADLETVQFRLKTLPGDLQAFAKDLYDFCPDIVDQGCGSVDALANEIRRQKAVFLWWD